MHAKQKTEIVPCAPGAFPGGLTRTRFYDGMLLTQKHMEREQNFWRMKRKLTNRALGTGVVWGLRLEWDSSKRKFLLNPGYAVDCCGNDLVVECPQEIAESTLIDKYDPQVQAFLSGKTESFLKCPEPDQDLTLKACLILKYIECAGDPQPVFEDDCTSNVTQCEYSSVRESVQLCLAPPPADPEPTPIAAFCKRLEELKKECKQLEGSTLFDSADALATNDFPVLIEVRNLTSGSPPVQVQPQVGAESATAGVDMVTPRAEDQLQITIRPAPGYVILSGVMPSGLPVQPFGEEFQAEGVHSLAADDPPFVINDLQVATLFTNGTNVRADLALSIAINDAESVFNVAASDYLQLPTAPTCDDKLDPWLIFNKAPECTVKTLALVVLCGWFKGLLADNPKLSPNGKHVAAWWICYLAWKVLFDANLQDGKASVLTDALTDLMQEWCAAFVYPGPYCRDDHHGVYLGCVELSRKGKIQSFDPWAHRRYVLTGPLLTYWGSLFGLAPVDVVVGRLAGWICCLGNASTPAVSSDIAASMIDGLPLDQTGLAIVAGDHVDYMNKHSLAMAGKIQTVELSRFVSLVTRQLASDKEDIGGAVSLSNTRRVYALRDTDLYLLVPVAQRRFSLPAAEREFIAHLVEARTAALRPLARGLVNEYAIDVAKTIGLAKLKVLTDDDVMSALVREVNKHEENTVADYLNLGPEKAARLALTNFDELDDVEDERSLFVAAEILTEASEEVLDSVIVPFVDDKVDTGGGPLLVEHLAEADAAKVVGKSIRKLLKANALSTADLRRVGKDLAERRNSAFGRDRE